MARNGSVVVRHRDLESGVWDFWRTDRVHLNAVGTDLWNLALQERIETSCLDVVGHTALRCSARAL